jgi:hypothetical protein
MPVNEKIIKILHSLIKFVQERTVKYSIRIESYLEMTKVIRDTYPDFQIEQCKIIETHLEKGIKNGEFIKHDTKLFAKDINLLITAVFNSYYHLSEAEFIYEVDLKAISNTVKRLISYIFEGIKK